MQEKYESLQERVHIQKSDMEKLADSLKKGAKEARLAEHHSRTEISDLRRELDRLQHELSAKGTASNKLLSCRLFVGPPDICLRKKEEDLETLHQRLRDCDGQLSQLEE